LRRDDFIYGDDYDDKPGHFHKYLPRRDDNGFNVNDALNEHNVERILEHDHDNRPDIEFNDDGSVHINTPGDYYFACDDNGNVDYACRTGFKSTTYLRPGSRWDTNADADDPALD
jgi:hypothetical protein